jgi:leucyl aminopeptidase
MPLPKSPYPFVSSSKKPAVSIELLANKNVSAWIEKQDTAIRKKLKSSNIEQGSGKFFVIHSDSGQVKKIIFTHDDPPNRYDGAELVKSLTDNLSHKFLKEHVFKITGHKLKPGQLKMFCTSWALACYRFNKFKDFKITEPVLIRPKTLKDKDLKSEIESICMVRDLINLPANILGPSHIESLARELANKHSAKINVVKGKALEDGFPLVHTVGKASTDKPRLIEITWGKTSDPVICIVGKGVSFDTGGLNIKTGNYMALMKKDMGGAAHALALAHKIMMHKLPLRLHVIIPAVENAIAGNAFRPGDIIVSRKGLSVENTNTDAEGRLILADALTYASEKKPDLIVDYATLTGSARAALGQEVPPFFSNNQDLARELEKLSIAEQDPLWSMPLWQNYKKHINGSVSDLVNSAGLPGDLIYSALFLESFLIKEPDWVHLDIFAWEASSHAGCPKGGTDMGLRAVYNYIEKRYS